jgi:hypothetical protein
VECDGIKVKFAITIGFSNYNWVAKNCVRELNLNRELLQTIWVNPKQFAKEAAAVDFLPDFGGGAVETSLALALGENLVRTPLVDFNSN